MLQTEFIRSLHSNYERVQLAEKPEEKRYQYCILSRGGIKGLLNCSLRYLDGKAYLYYDITSMQSVAQLYGGRPITRAWLKDFMWSYQQLKQELGRFLLDDNNVLMMPEQIFQDLENRRFAFLYMPYYEGESSFMNLIEYWVEHIDYEDEGLVDCVYGMYEKLEQNGVVYLQSQIFEDVKLLDAREETLEEENPAQKEGVQDVPRMSLQEFSETESREEKKGLLHLLEGRKRKNKEMRGDYREELLRESKVYAVAEEASYQEECGKTIYMEETVCEKKENWLYAMDGKVLAKLEKPVFAIGKKKGETDLVLDDISVSRIHARIIREKEAVYLEDMNSTNGTFKNGLRLQPYEKRKLEQGDEIKIGKVAMIYR